MPAPQPSTNLITAAGNTTYFSASSAWGQNPHGNKYEFLPQQDLSSNIYFTKHCPVCHENLVFPYNNTPSDFQKYFYVALREPPQNDSEHLYQWELTAAWVTPRWRWEWLGVGWQSHGKAVLPSGDWDVLHCDYMELMTRSKGRLTVRDATLGAFLPEGYNASNLQVYKPCSESTCHILNNEIYCQEHGWPAKWTWIVLVAGILMFSILVCCLKETWKVFYKPTTRRLFQARARRIDERLIQQALAKEREWQQSHQMLDVGPCEEAVEVTLEDIENLHRPSKRHGTKLLEHIARFHIGKA